MANEELAQTLDRLHAQLAEHPQLDAATLDSLRTLLTEIEAAFESSEANLASANTASQASSAEDANPQSLNDRLQEVILDFESRHPRLTLTLSQIADRLSEMGI